NAQVSWLEPRRLRDPFVIVLILAGFVFGLGPLLGPRQFSDITGFKGTDTLVIRLAGCATLGYGVGLLVGFRGAWREVWMAAVGGMLALRSRRWAEIRIPALMALTFNGTSLLAALLEVAGGGAQIVAYLIIGTAGLVTVGTALALSRNGR